MRHADVRTTATELLRPGYRQWIYLKPTEWTFALGIRFTWTSFLVWPVVLQVRINNEELVENWLPPHNGAAFLFRQRKTPYSSPGLELRANADVLRVEVMLDEDAEEGCRIGLELLEPPLGDP